MDDLRSRCHREGYQEARDQCRQELARALGLAADLAVSFAGLLPVVTACADATRAVGASLTALAALEQDGGAAATVEALDP